MYHDRVDDVTAFVLAGGKSTRMGRDKAFLELAGRTLLTHAIALAGTVAQKVVIVGHAKVFAEFGSVVEDVYPERGPLGGIHAALVTSATEWNLMLAVDLPFVEPKFLKYLASKAGETSATVVVARTKGGWQPLCALYRRGFAEISERSLREGRNKIDALFSEVETRVIGEEELSQAGFSEEMFHNLNTPEDWRGVTPDGRGH